MKCKPCDAEHATATTILNLQTIFRTKYDLVSIAWIPSQRHFGFAQAHLAARRGRRTVAAANPNPDATPDSVALVLSKSADSALDAASERTEADTQAANAETDARSIMTQACKHTSTAASSGLNEVAVLGHIISAHTSDSDKDSSHGPGQGRLQSSTAAAANALPPCVTCQTNEIEPAAVQSGTCAAAAKAGGVESSSHKEAGEIADETAGCTHSGVVSGGPELHSGKQLPASSTVADTVLQEKTKTKSLLHRGEQKA